jgi:hypothetical protein
LETGHDFKQPPKLEKLSLRCNRRPRSSFYGTDDGFVARLAKKQTDFGGYLDIVCDFAIYALLPVSIASSVQDLDLLFCQFCFAIYARRNSEEIT